MNKQAIYVLFFIFFVNSAAQGQKKYNVLFIGVDDLNIGFDAYGNTDVKCPNFSRLLQHGMWFKQTYIQYPLCSPSRTSIFSGLRPDSTGIIENTSDMRTKLGQEFKFLPEYFDTNQYRTEKFGKFTCEHEKEIDWDFVFDDYERERFDSAIGGDPVWWLDTIHKNVSSTLSGTVVNKGLLPALRNPVSTPYFYSLGLTAHTPFTPILDFWNKTGDSVNKELLPIDIFKNKTDVMGNGSGNLFFPDTPPDDTLDIPTIALKNLQDFSREDALRIRHSYYGEIMQEDYNLGLVLDMLDSLNIWDSTIVVFWSDHGLHMGEHDGLWLKTTLFEESLRVPLVICAPGKKIGFCNTVVELVDIFPTLTELCGLSNPSNLQGSSLVPLLENPEAPWKKAVFSQVRAYFDKKNFIMARSVRNNRFHYNNWTGYGEELYDIVNDPNEWTNLAINHPEYTDTLNNMRTLLQDGWTASVPPVYSRFPFYKDIDGDGFGENNDSLMAYFAPDGYVRDKGDCNDNDASVNPAAKEKRCNGLDDNCNNVIDENKPAPVIEPLGNLDICIAGYVRLSTNRNKRFSYQWRKDGIAIPGATKSTLKANVEGEYTVSISFNGCESISKSVFVTTDLCKAIAGKEENIENQVQFKPGIKVYPNPSKGLVTLSYFSELSSSIEIEIIDMQGKSVMQKSENAHKGMNSFYLDITSLLSGSYFLKLRTLNKTDQIQFIKAQ